MSNEPPVAVMPEQPPCTNSHVAEGCEKFDEKSSNIVESKLLRVQIDACIQNLRKAELNRRSRERSLSLTKLQEAVMWLGMDLKDLNAVNPYPNSYDPTNAIVEQTADGLKL